jgi:hypothetical protein
MNKIKRVSLFFRLLFQIMFVVLPLLLIVAWVVAPSAINLFGLDINLFPAHSYPILHPLSVTTKVLGFLISMIPAGAGLFVLYFLIKLFSLYEKGEIFSILNVTYIRNVGYTLLIGQLVNPFYDAFMSLALTWGNPPHQGLRFVTITVDGTNVGIFLTALLVILISWIMAEGYKLREEQQLTI